MGRLRWVLVALAILQVMLGVLDLSLGLRAGWLTIAAGIILGVTWVWMPRMLASGRKRIQRASTARRRRRQGRPRPTAPAPAAASGSTPPA